MRGGRSRVIGADHTTRDYAERVAYAQSFSQSNAHLVCAPSGESKGCLLGFGQQTSLLQQR